MAEFKYTQEEMDLVKEELSVAEKRINELETAIGSVIYDLKRI